MIDREGQAHLGAMAVLIAAAAFLHVRLGPVLPSLNAAIAFAVLVALLGFWLVVLGFRYLWGPPGQRSPETWRRQLRALTWFGNATLIARFWLCMPYADEPLRLLTVMFFSATATVLTLGTVAAPPRRPPLNYAPLALPLGLVPYFAVYWTPNSPLLMIYLISYSLALRIISKVLKHAFDSAYAERLASETALNELAVERDGKTRFLESAWHDLGQPLQAARLSFDQVLSTGDPVQRERAARRVTWAFDATEQLLRQMLDHLRLGAGAITPRIRTIAMGPLMARIAELNEPGARLVGVDMRVLASRLQVSADPGLCERVLNNPLGNSLRHAKASRVLIGARRRGTHVRLWVIDNGGGIPAVDEARLFDEYVQGSNHGDEIRGGFGLGLASSRRLARLMGGDLGLEPGWRKGSAFWLELPVAPPA